MRDACHVINKALFEAYRQLRFTMLLTVCWWVASLPLLTAGAAFAALLYALRRRATGDEREAWPLFLEGLRVQGRSGLLLLALNLFVWGPGALYVLVLAANRETWGIPATILTWGLIYVLLMWGLVQLLVWPLLVLEPQQRLGRHFKRAYLLASKYPGRSVALLILLLFVTALSILVPLLLITAWPVWIAWALYYGALHLLAQEEPTRYAVNLEVSWRSMWKTWR